MHTLAYSLLTCAMQAGDAMPAVASGARVGEWLASQHPALVHFPIALVLTAALLELLICLARRESWLHAQRFCLRFGAVCALLATAAGWFWAVEHEASAELELHRWLGVAGAALSLLAAVLVPRWTDSPRNIFRWALTAAFAGIVLAGHFGSYLVWGAEFFKSN